MRTIYIPATGMAFFRQIRRGLTYKFKVRALREYNQQQRARSVASRYSGDPTGSIWKAWDNTFNHRLKDKFILSSVQAEKAAKKKLIADWETNGSVRTLALKIAYDAGDPFLRYVVNSWAGITAAFEAIDLDIQNEEILEYANTAADGIISKGFAFYNEMIPSGRNWLRVAHDYGSEQS